MRIKAILFIMLWLLFNGPVTAFTSQNGSATGIRQGKEVYLVKKADNFIILYDRSGSMGDLYQGTVMTELAAERKILVEKNATLPNMNWMAGIYSFSPGHGLDNLTAYYPMQPYDKKLFSRTISKMPREPKGATMLQQGLNDLDRVLASLTGRTIIFLFTDGQYTPVDFLPSPSALAKRTSTEYDVCFAVIDTGSESKGGKEIKAIASVNDCSYMIPFATLLGNPEWMTNALFEVIEKEPVKPREMIVAYEWQNILFDFDKSDVKTEYHDILAEVGALLRNNPQSQVILVGHTDNIGTREYNMKLSHRRAASVRDYLVEKEAIDAGRITLSGFGFDDPVSTNDTPEGRALNRRVQGVITGIK